MAELKLELQELQSKLKELDNIASANNDTEILGRILRVRKEASAKGHEILFHTGNDDGKRVAMVTTWRVIGG